MLEKHNICDTGADVGFVGDIGVRGGKMDGRRFGGSLIEGIREVEIVHGSLSDDFTEGVIDGIGSDVVASALGDRFVVALGDVVECDLVIDGIFVGTQDGCAERGRMTTTELDGFTETSANGVNRGINEGIREFCISGKVGFLESFLEGIDEGRNEGWWFGAGILGTVVLIRIGASVTLFWWEGFDDGWWFGATTIGTIRIIRIGALAVSFWLEGFDDGFWPGTTMIGTVELLGIGA
jgi:hypothetical protein